MLSSLFLTILLSASVFSLLAHSLAEVFPRDLRQKDKLLKHLTGKLKSTTWSTKAVFSCIGVASLLCGRCWANWALLQNIFLLTYICVFSQGLCTSAQGVANSFIDYIIIPETARYLPVSAFAISPLFAKIIKCSNTFLKMVWCSCKTCLFFETDLALCCY